MPAWLFGPLMLAATVCGALVVLRGPDRAFVTALAALIGTAAAWVLISVFWPARADRTCPACGLRSLQRLDRRSTRGVACESCGHEDAHHSSFLLVEDEGDAIEPIVIGERAHARGSAR
jgi:hypothetical protein